jgi:cytochrome c553
MRFVLALYFSVALTFSAVVRADVAEGQSNGVSVVASYPSLKGQNADFIRKSLTDFRSGERKNPVMNAMAAGLKDEEINNLAQYIDSLK